MGYNPVEGSQRRYAGTHFKQDGGGQTDFDAPLLVIEKVAPWEIGTSSAATAAVLARNAQGDVSLNRTAAAAETHYFHLNCAPRTLPVTNYGIKLKKVRWFYEIAVADATSVDMLVDKTTFAQATAPAVAAHGGAIVDGDYDTAHDTAAERADKDVTGGEHVMTLTLNTPVLVSDRNTLVVSEFVAVLATTGTIKIRGAELEYELRGM